MENTAAEQKVMIQGPAGNLETMISGLENGLSMKDIGIMCHPHPLHQGTMQNKVVTTVIRTWQLQAFATVRFNFRGVGESAGNFSEGIGEVEDLKILVKMVREKAPSAKIWLAGFSFGAFIAAKVASEMPDVAGLLSIAPAIHLFDFLPLAIHCPWLIIHGGKDELIPLDQINAWYQILLERHQPQKQAKNNDREIRALKILPNATHFFHGCLNELRTEVQQFITPTFDSE